MAALVGCGSPATSFGIAQQRVLVAAGTQGSVVQDESTGELVGRDLEGRISWRARADDIGAVECLLGCARAVWAQQFTSGPTAVLSPGTASRPADNAGEVPGGDLGSGFPVLAGASSVLVSDGARLRRVVLSGVGNPPMVAGSPTELPSPVAVSRSDPDGNGAWLSGRVNEDQWWVAHVTADGHVRVLTDQARGPVLCSAGADLAVTGGTSPTSLSGQGSVLPVKTPLRFVSGCAFVGSALALWRHQAGVGESAADAAATSVDVQPHWQGGRPAPGVAPLVVQGGAELTVAGDCLLAQQRAGETGSADVTVLGSDGGRTPLGPFPGSLRGGGNVLWAVSTADSQMARQTVGRLPGRCGVQRVVLLQS